MKKKIGLREVEEFIIKERRTFHGGGKDDYTSKIRKYEEERKIVVNIMRRKLRENSKNCVRLRRDRLTAEVELRKLLGDKSRAVKKVMK